MKALSKKKKLITAIVTVVIMSTMFAIQAFASYLDYTAPHKNFYGKPIVNTSNTDVVDVTESINYTFGVLIALQYKYNNHQEMGTPALKVKKGSMYSTETRYYYEADIEAETVQFFDSILSGSGTYTVYGWAEGNNWPQCKITGQVRYF